MNAIPTDTYVSLYYDNGDRVEPTSEDKRPETGEDRKKPDEEELGKRHVGFGLTAEVFDDVEPVALDNVI